jgi:hypothetical protein
MASIFRGATAATARNLNNTALRSVCRTKQQTTTRCCFSSLANGTKKQNHDVNDWTSATPTPSSQYNFCGDDSSNIDSSTTSEIDDSSSSESSTQIQFSLATFQILDEDDDGG